MGLKNNIEIEVCACHSTEHHILFHFDPDTGYNDFMYLSIFLKQDAWYKRIWIGIKYIFGYKSRYGHYDEILFDRAGISRMRDRFVDILSKMPNNKKPKLDADI